MKGMIKYIKKIQRSNLFYIIAGLQILCLIAYYFFFIKGLAKTAGLTEAFKFLIFDSANYAGAIYTGIIAWILNLILMISVIVEIPYIKDFIDEWIYTYSYEDNDEYIEKNKLIINLILLIILLVCNIYFLTYLLLLILVIAICIVVIIILMK